MSAGHFFLAYIISLPIYIALDSGWISKIAKHFYQKSIGHLMAAKANLAAGGVFYLVFILGLTIFATRPAVIDHHFSEALWRGTLYGLATYGTFDLTSQAVFKNWPTRVSVIDMAWGILASLAATIVSYLVVANL